MAAGRAGTMPVRQWDAVRRVSRNRRLGLAVLGRADAFALSGAVRVVSDASGEPARSGL
ncbi:MAG: hypothetical protein NVSMB55_26880 [Mycobacteriales bacterium]